MLTSISATAKFAINKFVGDRIAGLWATTCWKEEKERLFKRLMKSGL